MPVSISSFHPIEYAEYDEINNHWPLQHSQHLHLTQRLNTISMIKGHDIPMAIISNGRQMSIVLNIKNVDNIKLPNITSTSTYPVLKIYPRHMQNDFSDTDQHYPQLKLQLHTQHYLHLYSLGSKMSSALGTRCYLTSSYFCIFLSFYMGLILSMTNLKGFICALLNACLQNGHCYRVSALRHSSQTMCWFRQSIIGLRDYPSKAVKHIWHVNSQDIDRCARELQQFQCKKSNNNNGQIFRQRHFLQLSTV